MCCFQGRHVPEILSIESVLHQRTHVWVQFHHSFEAGTQSLFEALCYPSTPVARRLGLEIMLDLAKMVVQLTEQIGADAANFAVRPSGVFIEPSGCTKVTLLHSEKQDERFVVRDSRGALNAVRSFGLLASFVFNIFFGRLLAQEVELHLQEGKLADFLPSSLQEFVGAFLHDDGSSSAAIIELQRAMQAGPLLAFLDMTDLLALPTLLGDDCVRGATMESTAAGLSALVLDKTSEERAKEAFRRDASPLLAHAAAQRRGALLSRMAAMPLIEIAKVVAQDLDRFEGRDFCAFCSRFVSN
jgi:hypothetical protein